MDLRAADAGIEFLVGVGGAAGVFSAVHSSLWSARNFGDTAETAASCRTYSWVAAGATIAFTGFGSLLTKSVWPLAGGLAFTALMLVGYRHSLAQAGDHDQVPDTVPSWWVSQ